MIYRINREFVKRAPDAVEFVDHPKKADFQIVQCLGAGSLTQIHSRKFVLFQHCLRSADIGSRVVWLGVFNQALMVVSYIDIPSVLNARSFNFHHTPWGVDTDVFCRRDRQRTKAILTTGWSCAQEAIKECYLAANRCRKKTVNIGDDFRFGEDFSAASRITDFELCSLYNECEFVSGLRFKEGFEVSVVEGLACGCRPICFNLPVYTEWFEDLAYYVPHCKGSRLVAKIETILRQGAAPVSEKEIAKVKDKFDWQKLTARFWRKAFEYV